jgi:hypothetical protein
MSRGWVLGVVVGIGALSAAAGIQGAGAARAESRRSRELKDNLYMLKGGGNTAVFVGASVWSSSTRRIPDGDSRSSTRSRS